MGLFLRLYINALLKGNPFVIGITIVGAVALSLGPFSRGIKSGDPAAIGLVVLAALGIVLVLTVSIIDRWNDPEFQRERRKKKKKKKKPQPTSSPARRAGPPEISSRRRGDD